MLESKIEKRLCDGVKALGGLCLKWVSPGCTGVPDRIVILPNCPALFVELKQEKGRPSARQKYMMKNLNDLGQAVHILYTEESVDAYLERCRILVDTLNGGDAK